MNQRPNFYNLDPNLILSVAEKSGYSVTGELTQLNSYENRVFDIKVAGTFLFSEKSFNSQKVPGSKSVLQRDPLLEPGPFWGDSIIAKFYRPQRWSKETILDEHAFLRELKSEGIEVAQTLKLRDSKNSVGEADGIYFSFFEKVRGRLLQELTLPHYKKVGRWLARLHNVGAREEAQSRPYIGPSNDNKWPQLEKLLSQVSLEVAHRYEDAAVRIFEQLDEALPNFNFIRLHGDLHRGNILENSQSEFVVVDFDDMVNGPEVQDFWMLMPSADLKSEEFETLIQAYSELREFPYEQLELIPLLRGYRIINYAIWIMNRWDDPSFPKIFPDFGSYSYWAEETESLEKIIFSQT